MKSGGGQAATLQCLQGRDRGAHQVQAHAAGPRSRPRLTGPSLSLARSLSLFLSFLSLSFSLALSLLLSLALSLSSFSLISLARALSLALALFSLSHSHTHTHTPSLSQSADGSATLIPNYAHVTNVFGVASNRLFQFRDLYWRAPEFGGVWYKSRHLKQVDLIAVGGRFGDADTELRARDQRLWPRHLGPPHVRPPNTNSFGWTVFEII